jgi:hypothetical protein
VLRGVPHEVAFANDVASFEKARLQLLAGQVHAGYLLYWYNRTNTDDMLVGQPKEAHELISSLTSGLAVSGFGTSYAALSYWCRRPYATGVCGLMLLVYAALRHCFSHAAVRLVACQRLRY